MAKKFNERFQISVSADVAKARFVNRVHNDIYDGLVEYQSVALREQLRRLAASHIGTRYQGFGMALMVGDNFEQNLRAVEGVYEAFGQLVAPHYQQQVAQGVEKCLRNAESDLGIKWENGAFYPSGAKLLDEHLVNDPLHWLRAKGYKNAVEPYEKGLRHLLEARKRPELAQDVVTDAYEAIEALAKVITGRTEKDLSGNQELFIAKVKASDAYKKLLKDYIEYANLFRHAEKEGKPRPKISLEEAESFIYLTGVFIRLAVTAK